MPLLPEVSEKMSGELWMASYAHSLLGRNEERRLAITEDYWVEKGVCSGLLSKESSKQVWCGLRGRTRERDQHLEKEGVIN